MLTDKETENIIKEVVSRHINLRESFVFLFGSRASKQSRINSDYDIGLYGDKKVPFGVIAKINNELENYPIPVDIDIVDFTTTTPEFRRIALREIQIWNKPEKNLKLI
jgi:predicted nucleotidyltransferase